MRINLLLAISIKIAMDSSSVVQNQLVSFFDTAFGIDCGYFICLAHILSEHFNNQNRNNERTKKTKNCLKLLEFRANWYTDFHGKVPICVQSSSICYVITVHYYYKSLMDFGVCVCLRSPMKISARLM